MKNIISFALFIFLSFFAYSNEAIQFLAPIQHIKVSSYANLDICNDTIDAEDITSWLQEKDNGWYTTTGNGDTRWDNATVDAQRRILRLPNMKGTDGVCAAQKIVISDLEKYQDATFSFSLLPAGPETLYTWSLFYENKEGKSILLNKESKINISEKWNVSWNMGKDRYRELIKNGNGTIYMVFGSVDGPDKKDAYISNISLRGIKQKSLIVWVLGGISGGLILLLIIRIMKRK